MFCSTRQIHVAVREFGGLSLFRLSGVFAALVFALLAATAVQAQQAGSTQPVFEAGIFGAGGYFPDYPASNQSHFHALPLPYVVYRGEYFQLSETGARGVLYETPAIAFDLSAAGSFKTRTTDNDARQGMPALDYLGEVGPRLRVLLAKDAMFAKIDLEIPVRAVFSTNLSNLRYRGWRAAPEIAYTHFNFLDSGGRLKLGIGPQFATKELMDYFYQVQPQFATPTRSAYDAKAGYLGSRFEASYRYPLNGRVTLFTLGTAEYYKGAANAGSPLFKQDYGLSAAFGVAFSFYRSEAVVDRTAGE